MPRVLFFVLLIALAVGLLFVLRDRRRQFIAAQVQLLQSDDATAATQARKRLQRVGRSAAPNPEAFGGFRSEVIPIHDICVGLPGAFRSIHLEPGATPITGTSRDGLTWVTVPTLEQHAMVMGER